MTAIKFEWTDFDDRYDNFARNEHLPRLARAAMGLISVHVPDAKAKRLAIKAAEASFDFMRSYIRTGGAR